MEKKVMDFENGNPKDQINAWVSESTKGKIQKLLLEDLQKNASSVLVNTVYFNGDWLDTFDIDCTTEDFYGDNETTKVEMMRGEKEYYQYYEDEEFQMVSLPFYDREYCFNILMSKDKEVSTPQLFAGKSEREQEKLFEELLSSEDRKVVVHLPKFEFEYGTLSLKEMLQALGMEDAFSGKDAYFPEIQGENAENFFVEDVLHKTKIEVKERGVTAAAATAIIKEAGALPGEPTPEPYIYFNVDHSFVYTITDSDGMIYFVGQVSDLVK